MLSYVHNISYVYVDLTALSGYNHNWCNYTLMLLEVEIILFTFICIILLHIIIIIRYLNKTCICSQMVLPKNKTD